MYPEALVMPSELDCILLLSVANTHSKLLFVVFILLHHVEEFLTCYGHDPFICPVAYHGVTLPRARLPVRKQGGVITLPSIVQHSLAKVREHIPLEDKNKQSGVYIP